MTHHKNLCLGYHIFKYLPLKQLPSNFVIIILNILEVSFLIGVLKILDWKMLEMEVCYLKISIFGY